MTVWREFVHTDRAMKPKALRTLDHIFFMRSQPMLTLPGKEKDAADALLVQLEALREQTRTDMISLFRMDEQAIAPWREGLEAHGIASKFKMTTVSPQIRFEGTADEYLIGKHKRMVKEIERKRRKHDRETGVELTTRCIQAHDIDDAAFEACLQDLEALEERSWQAEWEQNSERVDYEKTRAFNREAMALWRRRKMLTLYFMDRGEQPVAFWICLYSQPKLWVLVTGYDPDYHHVSIGLNSLVSMIRDVVDGMGVTTMELGGNVTGWKERWLTDAPETYQAEWSLGSVTGRMWGAAQSIKKILGK